MARVYATMGDLPRAEAFLSAHAATATARSYHPLLMGLAARGDAAGALRVFDVMVQRRALIAQPGAAARSRPMVRWRGWTGSVRRMCTDGARAAGVGVGAAPERELVARRFVVESVGIGHSGEQTEMVVHTYRRKSPRRGISAIHIIGKASRNVYVTVATRHTTRLAPPVPQHTPPALRCVPCPRVGAPVCVFCVGWGPSGGRGWG